MIYPLNLKARTWKDVKKENDRLKQDFKHKQELCRRLLNEI